MPKIFSSYNKLSLQSSFIILSSPTTTITTISSVSLSTIIKNFYIFYCILNLIIVQSKSYLIIVNETTLPGTVIFNTSVYKLGSERNYKLNVHKSAYFVHNLIDINSKDGQVRLKKSLKCDGIFYPNLFTFYVDSTSNRLRSIDYYSLPLRIFVAGKNCNDDRRIEINSKVHQYRHHFHSDDDDDNENEDDDGDNSYYKKHRRRRRRRKRYITNSYISDDNNEEFYDHPYHHLQQQKKHFEYDLTSTIIYKASNSIKLNRTVNNYYDGSEFHDGDILFSNSNNDVITDDEDRQSTNELRQRILSRKRRVSLESLSQKMHNKITDAKQWISETYASYAIHTTDKWNKICLKKSQFINNLNAFLPKTICQYCRVNFLDVSDERFKIETQNRDLVANLDVCIYERIWKVIVTFSIRCNRNDIIDSDHKLKIVYHHQEFNDTDIARRVRRELRNQSPYFEQALYIASVLEEQPMGAIVTTVRARDPEDSPVVYSMVSLLDSRSQSMFKIDSRTGVVTTSASLDRELMDQHYFRVVATDDSFPPRSGTTTLQVNVLDCNDHSPTFEAEQFEAQIRESATVGSTVITLRATDQDVGKNAEIEYNIESVTGGGLTTHEQDAQTFRIDGRTGVISTRNSLDREASEVYTLLVTATDMATPQSERKSATATVVVKVLDDNDNYPQFSERTYSVQVSEDQWSNSNNVVAHIKATDADRGNNAAIRYAIIGGNTQSQFSIDSMSGEVSLVKHLDYESVRSYRLVIRAQDGGSPSRSNTTQLLVNVLDANDNAPRFYTQQFQESVLESVPIGYNIIRVQAYDSDEGSNAEITYSILERDINFPVSIDPRTGWISTIKQLDREEQSRYAFQVIAVDGGIPPKSASASVIITVQDVNDNDPTFRPKYYEAAVSEDQSPGTPVITVTATDPDEDSRLHYEITAGNTRGRFAITSQNGRGLITVAQPLDYKQEKRFLLTITATDSGGRTDTATVNINITDANNFAPIFENAPYSASVFEDAPIGTTVLVVSATDADVGINAQITYSLNDESINGLSINDPFSINPQTGAIVTNALLDRETKDGYLLTVTAKDGGHPSLSDTTDIEISVTDVNDNAPAFKIPLYQASIPEDALIGTPVIQISATDIDTGLNGRIKYMLGNKDIEDGSFVVDPTSGTIRTNKALDRESVAVYHLTAIAIDKGSPSLSSSVEVQIRLEDVNDSPPTFPSDKITLYVPENSPVGSVVGEIHAHDPDEGVNAIVQYSIIGGDDSNSFSLVTRPGSERAQLLTMTELDYESSRKRFELIIRAASPPLRNDVHVEVLVTDVNDNAPILKDFQVIFNNFRDHFPNGEIGRVPAFDADVTDKLTYKILSGNNANLIRLNTSTGGLTLSPQLNTNVPKFATMEVSVTDGINEAKAIMQFIVRLITEDMLFNSVTIRLNEMTEEAFLSPLLNYFLDGLAAIIPCPKENIFLFSIQDDTDVSGRILNVSFSARRPDVPHEEYYTSQYLQEKVYLNRAILARLATVEVLPFDDNLCVREPCLNFEQCLTVLKFGNASDFIHSDTILFRPIYPVNTFACECPDGFTGSKEHYLCDTEVDLCYSNPCLNGGKCKRREGGYTCICESNFTGVNCEKDIKILKSCMSDLCDGGYSCIQNTGSGVSAIPLQPPPYTATCELKARSFSKNSFLTFESLRQRYRFNLKLKFATLYENGLLLYNGRYNELHDFIALEILDGRISFSFSLGDTTKSVIVSSEEKISDGNWHTVEIMYLNRTVTLILDECDVSLALAGNLGPKWNCANQTTLILDKRCASLTETCHRFLDLTGPLQIGGLPRIPAHFPVKTQEFIGCISDFMIDDRLIDLNSYVADNGTIAGCPQKSSTCSSEPCFNGGICKEGWGSHICDCPEGFTGNSCQEAISLPWRFSGDGVLSFNPLLRQIQLPWLTAISIRTRQKNAFLIQIQIGQNSSAVLSLKNGIFQYTYDNEPIYLPGTNLADGEWHRLEVKWLGSEIHLSVDYAQRTGVVSTSQKVQGLYVGKIVIGSPDGSLGNIKDYNHYEGCIQDVRVGGMQSVLNRPTIRENVEDGCISRSECPESCPIHSSCVTSWDEAHCECLAGYIGSECVPICTVQPCVAGICRVDITKKKSYYCECNTTIHSGEYCEIPIERPCPAGWWGEHSCGPCNCNLKQGYHPDCNKTTGQCYCKNNHYQPPNETACLPCDCYSIGSFSSSCDRLTGQCECRDGVIGRRCDSCSNPYAEVTLTGCEVVYDSCPRSFAGGIWWPRTTLGKISIENCPRPAKGKGSRSCDSKSGKWELPDMFNCTSEPFIELRKQLSQLERMELELNSFVAVKMIENLRMACEIVSGNSKNSKSNDNYSYRHKLKMRGTPSFLMENDPKSLWTTDADEMEFLNDEVKFIHDKLYGADLLITEGILHELISYEITQKGLNLSHSQDKYFIKNLVFSAGTIFDRKYSTEWNRIMDLVQRGPHDLVDSINKYMAVLAKSQHDTYTNPFEIAHKNMIFGLDIVTVESLYGYAPEQLSDYHRTKIIKMNQFTTESVILPDTSAFLQYSSKMKPIILIPKYNNYLQNKDKFDNFSKILIPLDLLGIVPPDKNEISYGSSSHRAIISYAEYKDAGAIFPANYDETVTRRWGVDIQIASPVLSLVILVPSTIPDNQNDSHLDSMKMMIKKSQKTMSSISLEQIKEFEAVNNTNRSLREDHDEELITHENIKIMAHNIDGIGSMSKDSKETQYSNIQVRFSDEIEFQDSNRGAAAAAVLPTGGTVNIRNFENPRKLDISSSEKRDINSSEDNTDGNSDYEISTSERKSQRERRDLTHYVDQHDHTNSLPTETSKQIIYRALGTPHLSQPIKLQIWIDVESTGFSQRSNPQCIRWNSMTNSWTRLGCKTEIPDYETFIYGKPVLINCSCIHVSNYAVIVDVIDPEDLPEPSLLMQVTSFSAFVVSLVLLMSVLIALALLRGMQTNSNTIHQNLILCVFFAELLFFIGIHSRRNLVENEFTCKLIAICLHYTWLAAFAWTTVDCVHLYRMLTEMRDINHGPMGFYFSMGYGAPAIIVGLSVGVRAHEYGNSLFCWLSVYEPVVWWLVGPISGLSIINLLILFLSVKAAFTLKNHVLGFGNLRTLLWLSVVSLPMMGVIWVLAVLVASDNAPVLSVLLSTIVVIHAIFCLIGYCIINKRVRENLHRTFLRCIGRKVPLLDSSLVVSSSSHNINGTGNRGNNFLNASSAGNYDSTRRNIGISASSTTSRSTAKTSSSPYRSDGQLRHTSTSTSNYNSASEAHSYMRGFKTRREGTEKQQRRHRKDSDSGSETDGRSLELASSHSSDDDESNVGRTNSTSHRSTGVTAVTTQSYLPNITEHVQATTPPELNVVQSPQLFPSLNKPVYASRWSSQLPEAYLPSSANVGRWSQDTGSDNEIHSYKTSSPNPLPNPDLTDTSYLHQHQNKINMPPSILENIQNMRNNNDYDIERDSIYGGKRKESYGGYSMNLTPTPSPQPTTLTVGTAATLPYKSTQYGNDKDYDGVAGSTQIINHMRTFHDSPYLKDSIYDKQQTLGPSIRTKTDSPYISRERIATPDIYSTRDSHYSLKSPVLYTESIHNSVHPMLKTDYKHNHHNQRSIDYQSDRMSEGSDKNGYHFPYTAEEDHLTTTSSSLTRSSNIHHHHHHHHHLQIMNDVNNTSPTLTTSVTPTNGKLSSSRGSSRHGSRSSSPSTIAPMQPLAPLSRITDTSEKAVDGAETTV